jgi:type II secretory pathway component PulF
MLRKSKVSLSLLRDLLLYLKAGYDLERGLKMLDSNLSLDEFYEGLNEYQLLLGFMKFLPLVVALQSMLDWQRHNLQLRSTLLKLLVYPVVQLVMGLVLSGLLQWWIPQLLSMIDGTVQGLWLINVCQVLLLLLVLVFGVMGYVFWQEQSVVLWIFDRWPQQWLIWWCVMRWVDGWLVIRQQCNNSVEQMLLLRQLPIGKVGQAWSSRLHLALSEGVALDEAMVVVYPPLVKVVKMGCATMQLDELLILWNERLRLRLFNHLKWFSYGLQGFIYLYVGLLVWIVSQVMLVPLGLLERI